MASTILATGCQASVKPGKPSAARYIDPLRVLLDDLVQTSRRVAATSGRLAKTDLLAGLLTRAAPGEIETAIAFLSGVVRQKSVGVGYATLSL
jgi:hypothetical protein